MGAQHFNIATRRGLPVRRASGAVTLIRPADITRRFDPTPSSPSTGRARLPHRHVELLIACSPWPFRRRSALLGRGMGKPPSPRIGAAFAPFAMPSSDGEVRVPSDTEDLAIRAEPVETLLTRPPERATRSKKPPSGQATVRRAFSRATRRHRGFLVAILAPAGGAASAPACAAAGRWSRVRPERAALWLLLGRIASGAVPPMSELPRISWLAPPSHPRGADRHPRRSGPSASGLLGHAAPHPAGFRDAGRASPLRCDRRAGCGPGYRLAPAPARRELCRLGQASPALAPLSDEGRGRMAAGASSAGQDRLSPLAGAGRRGCATGPRRRHFSWRRDRRHDPAKAGTPGCSRGLRHGQHKAPPTSSEMPLPAAPPRTGRLERWQARGARGGYRCRPAAQCGAPCLFSPAPRLSSMPRPRQPARTPVGADEQPFFDALSDAPTRRDAQDERSAPPGPRCCVAAHGLVDEAAPLDPAAGAAAPRIANARRS